MKKFFTLVAMAMMAIGANAQTLIAEKEWAGQDIPEWYFVQFADGQEGEAKAGADGMEITVGTTTGELWQPQVQVMDGLKLEEDHNYKVVVTAKFPCDGTLQINMGNWAGRDQYTTDVTATGDFQEVEVAFDGYAYNVADEEGNGNGFVLFQCGAFQGTSVVKKVQVYDMDGEPGPGPQPGDGIVGEKDWAGVDIPEWYFVQFADGQEGEAKAGADGMEITVGTTTGELWQPQVQVMDGLLLEEDNDYAVIVTAKFPCDGTLQINMGNWAGRDQYTTDVAATGDFQDVQVDFDGFAYNVADEEGNGNGFVLFQCGAFQGTSVVKHVKVINKNASGIKNVKANKALNNVRYNLAGQKVDASYKGIVIQNGKKFIQK